MRVIHIFGASNSIGANSFAWILKDLLHDDPNWCVSINSIAASGTSAALFGLSRASSIKPGDIALIDHEINDSGLIDRSIRDAAEVNAIIASCVAKALSLGALPVLLVLPTVRASKSASPGERVAEALSNAGCLPIVNLAKAFRQAVASDEISSYLRDPYHPTVYLSKCIAEFLRDAFIELNGCYEEVILGSAKFELAGWAGSFQDSPDLQLIERTSSARTAVYAQLREGQTVSFQVPYGYCLLALVINSAVNGGILEKSNGYSVFNKRLIFDWQLPSEMTQIAIAVDVKRRFHAFDKGISVTLIDDSKAIDCEFSLHEKEKIIESQIVEIEGVVCLDYMRLRPPNGVSSTGSFQAYLNRFSSRLVRKAVAANG